MLNLSKKSETAVVIVDLAPQFNVPKSKSEFVESYLSEIYQHLTDYYVYYTHVYKHALNKKIFVETSEDSYNSIVAVASEVEYLLTNVLRVSRVLVVSLGKYKEYSYLNRLLKKYYEGNSVAMRFTSVKHYSNYVKNNWNLDDDSLSSDVKSIERNIKYLESGV